MRNVKDKKIVYKKEKMIDKLGREVKYMRV